MIIKKDIGLDDFNALVNFINGPDAVLTAREVGGILIFARDTPVRSSQVRVVRLKGNIQVAEGGDGFGVTVEIDERVRVDRDGEMHATDVPARFLTHLLKALGAPLE